MLKSSSAKQIFIKLGTREIESFSNLSNICRLVIKKHVSPWWQSVLFIFKLIYIFTRVFYFKSYSNIWRILPVSLSPRPPHTHHKPVRSRVVLNLYGLLMIRDCVVHSCLRIKINFMRSENWLSAWLHKYDRYEPYKPYIP